MQTPHFYPIGTPGQAWGDAERAQWRARQVRQRSYADDVLTAIEALRSHFDVQSYGELRYGNDHHAEERFPLMALRSRDWQSRLPSVLVTGGVHGYETSGVHGALRFLQAHAAGYAGRVNLLVAPCVSPWGYERIQRWNFDAIDPNRAFRSGTPPQECAPQECAAQECAALMRLVAPLHGQWAAHLDLHETTDTDKTEFRPAVAARDGTPFAPCSIPDGFYLVDDSANPQPAFQQAIIEAVARVTHIAPGAADHGIIGSPLAAHGVIRYAMQSLGLCAGISGARYTTTTEVYPDSPRATPEQCIAAQVAAVCAGVDFVCTQGS
ncbi:MAG: M14 family metallocarboxypeptidase [Simplicispira sp.]|nr:M14 family metallocarboxypeptidase [Simplicispira sp.]